MATSILPMGVPARKTVPKPATGPIRIGAKAGDVPKKNTRDYGKPAPAMAPPSPAPDPFGAVPGGGSRMGGI